MTDALIKELERIEALSSLSPTGTKAKSVAMGPSIDELLEHLQHAKQAMEAGADPDATFQDLGKVIEQQKKSVDERQKELHNALVKFGKGVDKKFPDPLPTSGPMFQSAEDAAALQNVIGMHLIRTGSFGVADVFYKARSSEYGQEPPQNLVLCFQEMHSIVDRLREGNVVPALEWARNNRAFLQSRHSTLEFDLHRSHFVRLVLASDPPHASAIAYSRQYFAELYEHYPQIIPQVNRLISSLAWTKRLENMPYPDLLKDTIHTDLEPAFVREYCARLGLSRQLPLQVVTDIGGNGALAKIEKSKKIMKDRRGKWEVNDELMIEIPLPPQNRYHSVFACPVSKEQSTEKNPPMMLTCGHVIAKESVTRLTKGGGRIKCPYCPVESTGPPLQVHF